MAKVKAKDLFFSNQRTSEHPSYLPDLPLNTRILRALVRAYGKDAITDKLLYEKIVSGELWTVRDLGDVSIKDICIYLERSGYDPDEE